MEDITFSASRIKLAHDCFGKYYFRYMKRIKVPQILWPGTVFGLVTHRILEETLLAKKAGSDDKKIIEGNKGLFEKYFNEILNEKKDTQKFKKSRDYAMNPNAFLNKGEKGVVSLTKFILKYFDGYKEVYPEEAMKERYVFSDNIILNGVADLPIEISDDNFRIVDFKTTKDSNNFYFVHWDTDVQSKFYFYLAWKKFGKFPDGFDYLVFNHVTKNIFLNSVTAIEKPTTEKEFSSFFAPLTYQINEVVRMHKDPKTEYYNPEAIKCGWCEYSDWCEKSKSPKRKKKLKEIPE